MYTGSIFEKLQSKIFGSDEIKWDMETMKELFDFKGFVP